MLREKERLVQTSLGNERAIQVEYSNWQLSRLRTYLRARHIVRELIDNHDCDFLLRDRQGRLASELAISLAAIRKLPN